MAIRGISLILILIAVVAAPAGGVIAYFLITHDQSVRPLAITVDTVAAEEAEETGSALIATINWGENAKSGADKSDVTHLLRRAFGAHGVDIAVRVIDVPASDQISVGYSAGRNHFGPYSLANAAQGIRGAIVAFRMIKVDEPEH